MLAWVALLGAAGGAVAQQPAYAQVTGSPFTTLTPQETGNGPSKVAFSPAGGLLATVNFNSSDMSVFEVAADGTLSQVDGSPFSTIGPAGGGYGPISFAFSPGGGLLATTSQSFAVVVFKVAADGKLTQVPGSPFSTTGSGLTGRGPSSVAFSPDGSLVATANDSGDVTVFKVAADGTLSQVDDSPFSTTGPAGVGNNPRSLAFSPDGKLLAVANAGSENVSVFAVAAGGKLSPVNRSPFSTAAAPDGGLSSPYEVVFSPDGKLLVARTIEGELALFTVAADGQLSLAAGSPFSPGTFLVSPAFSPGGGLLATVDGNDQMSVFEVAGDPTLTPVPGSPFLTTGPPGSGEGPLSVAFGRGGRLLATANSSNDVSVFFATGALEIGKAASVGVARPGGVVSYTVTVRNPGPDPVVAAVSDDLSGLLGNATYLSDASASSGSVTFSSSSSTLTWDGVLAVGASARITYSVRVHAGLLGGVLSNRVTGPPGSTCGGPDPVLPCMTVTPIEPEPVRGPDLVLTKVASSESVHPGGQVMYGLVVHNRGTGEATGVTVFDPGPSGVFFQQARPSQGQCSINQQLRCALGDIPVGGSAVVLVTATVRGDASGTIVNLATVDDDRHDPRPGNNTATTMVRVTPLPRPPTPDPGPQPVSNLVVRKHASRSTAQVGQTLSYTITVANNGPQPAADVRLTDAARLRMRVVSVRASQGSCQAGTPIRCRLGTLASRTRARVTITAVATVKGTQVNAAMVTSGSWDPATAANIALARTAVGTVHITPQPPRPPRPHRPPPFTG